MRLLLLADVYLPSRISAARQLHDLAAGFVREGHRTAVVAPAPGLRPPWFLEELDGVSVLRVRAPRTKGVPLVRRALAEMSLPWILGRGLRASPLGRESWDGLVWYSPTIFLGPLVRRIKRRHGARAYLVLRDLFPDWAADSGVLSRRGLPYRFFKTVERRQYLAADVIGVESPGNVPPVRATAGRESPRVEVLENWRTPPAPGRAPPPDPRLEGRRVFVYAGNLGLAQGVDRLLDLVGALADRPEAAFLFVGRGHETARVRERLEAEGRGRAVFRDEVDEDVLVSLLSRCAVGLVSLDPRSSVHNIPGKFLTYLFAGLPVLALVNPASDLARVIVGHDVGRVPPGGTREDLRRTASEFLDMPAAELAAMGRRARGLAAERYETEAAVRKILSALRPEASAGRDARGLS